MYNQSTVNPARVLLVRLPQRVRLDLWHTVTAGSATPEVSAVHAQKAVVSNAIDSVTRDDQDYRQAQVKFHTPLPTSRRSRTMFIEKSSQPSFQPWNKGKLIGQKPQLQPKHVWAIRTKLQLDGKTRDLALFNLAIDS